MVKRFELGEKVFWLGLRHKWDKQEKTEKYYPSEFRTLYLGISFSFSKDILRSSSGRKLNSYYIGLNLLFFKFWIYFTVYNKKKNGN